MATADLVHLIDLSLGTQPCGVVNFNYLHGLLHEICKRLVQLEGLQGPTILSLPSLPEAMVESTRDSVSGSAKDLVTDSTKDSTKDVTKDSTNDSSAKDSTNDSRKDSSAKDSIKDSRKDSSAKDSSNDISAKDSSAKDSSAKDSSKDSTKDSSAKDSTKDSSVKDSIKDSSAKDSTKDSSVKDSTKDTSNSKVSVNESSDEDNGKSQSLRNTPTPSRRAGSGFFKSRSSFVSAANDLGALERKLSELESRVNTMESLPDLLEKKSSDSQSTPASDLWNFTNLTNRIGASEEGLDKAFSLIDDLLGEINSTREHVNSLHSNVDNVGQKLSGSLKSLCSLEGKVDSLEELKLAAAKDSMGDAATAVLSDLTSKTGSLEDEISALKASLEGLPANMSNLVTREDLETTLSQHDEVLQQRHEVDRKNQSESLASLKIGLAESQETIGEIDERVGTLREELDKLKTQVQETEAAISTKVNILDLTSLMPQAGGSDEGPSLMPKLLEMQNKLTQVEAQLASAEVPSDKLSTMQSAIDRLQSQLTTFASSLGSTAEDRNKVEELGSLVAQLRERMAELDRAVTAVSNAVSQGMGPTREALPEDEADSARKYVDMSSFEALQELLGQLHSEQERLIGTAAHLSHEVGVSKEHVKTLYGNVDDLKDTKVDKELLEVEVRAKADKNALDGKASRDWVDSTFDRLDREIREAASKLLGQEEALKNAMNQLGEDVEGKLDRLELEPLKDYFDKKLERVKPAAPVAISEALGDDAAGFKRPLRVRCISCDKPVGVRPLDAIPTLPAGGLFPDTRSFRPYTTYELELIRRHQKIGSPVVGSLLPILEYPRSIRSAGGIHTKTRPHQRIRVAPLGQGYIPDPTYTPPPPPSRHTASPSVHEELEIVGHDGHVYKGRSSRNRLPPLATNSRTAGRPRVIRPSTVTS